MIFKKLGSFKKLFLHIVNYGLGSVIAQIIGFFLIPIYTRYLNPEDYGIVELVVAITGMLVPIIKLGLPGAVTRFYFDYRTNVKQLKNYITTLYRLLNASALFFSVIILLLFYFFGKYWFPDNVEFWPFLVLAVLTAAFSSNNQLQQKLLQNREQSRYSMILKLSLALLGISLALLFIVVFRMGAIGIVLSSFITTFLFFFQAIFYLRKDIKGSYDKKMAKESFSYGLGILPHHLVASASPFLTKTILSKVADLTSLGIYSIGLRFIAPLNILSSSTTTALVPLYNGFRINNNTIKIKQLIRQILLLNFVVFVLYIIVTPFLMKLMLPPNYLSSIDLVPILAISFIGKSLYQVNMVEVFYSKKTKYISLLTAIGLILNVLIFVALVANMAEEAICWGFSIGFLSTGILSYIYKKKVSEYYMFTNELFGFTILSFLAWSIAIYWLY